MIIYLEDVVVGNHQGKVLLGPISLTLCKGLIAVIGPNGAGKSTLLKAIAKVYSTTHGTIKFERDDKPLSLFEQKLSIGYVPQEVSVYDEMKVSKYLSYIAELKCLDAKQVKVELQRISQQFSLEQLLNKRLFTLSEGQKRKVMIAQAFLGSPQILLLDEPFANLDIEEREHLLHLIAISAQDKIVILATHMLEELNFSFDNIIFLNNGKLHEVNGEQEKHNISK